VHELEGQELPDVTMLEALDAQSKVWVDRKTGKAVQGELQNIGNHQSDQEHYRDGSSH
jgi:hypothetical protein